MSRKRISAKMRVEIFERHKGVCHMCGLRVVAGQVWEVSHEIPLECGGADDETNWKVAHRSCHRHHTATVDIPTIAKVKRIRQKHLGAKLPSRNTLPGGKNSEWKRTLDGRVVPRRSK